MPPTGSPPRFSFPCSSPPGSGPQRLPVGHPDVHDDHCAHLGRQRAGHGTGLGHRLRRERLHRQRPDVRTATRSPSPSEARPRTTPARSSRSPSQLDPPRPTSTTCSSTQGSLAGPLVASSANGVADTSDARDHQCGRPALDGSVGHLRRPRRLRRDDRARGRPTPTSTRARAVRLRPTPPARATAHYSDGRPDVRHRRGAEELRPTRPTASRACESTNSAMRTCRASGASPPAWICGTWTSIRSPRPTTRTSKTRCIGASRTASPGG